MPSVAKSDINAAGIHRASRAKITELGTGAPASPAKELDALGLLALLQCEGQAREAATKSELQFLIVNETRRFNQSRQIFLLEESSHLLSRKTRFGVTAISDLSAIDPSAPMVQEIEDLVARLQDSHDLTTPCLLDPPTDNTTTTPELVDYPYKHLLWIPLKVHGRKPLGGLLLARGEAWPESDRTVSERLAAAYSHALALHRERSRYSNRLIAAVAGNKRTASLSLAAFLLMLVVPVRMTTLAPFEIVPREPIVVAATIDGAIEDILVEPNADVREGQLLVKFSDVVLRNRLEVAQREVQVADAHMKQATQLGFDQQEGRSAIGIAAAEHRLRLAEQKAAQELLARASVNAPKAGVALYHDRSALMGKPVVIGERIMLIADPRKVDVAIDVPVSDALLLKTGARAKIFLDSDPVRPREAVVELADYQARQRPGGSLAYRVVAKISDGSEAPRLGVRGTAQLYGERVPLAFYLFRRPLSFVRQWIGL